MSSTLHVISTGVISQRFEDNADQHLVCKELDPFLNINRHGLCAKRKNRGGATPAGQTWSWGIIIPITLNVTPATPLLYYGASDYASTCMHERSTGNRRLVKPRLTPLSMSKMTKERGATP
ncbi:hypothetical protein N7493_001876 [Penicillium malachiteum]|uniref:Uncharacterized protein n=1 Tax=Penicillium malachiteum TaxID=1324776 RepID=A0AAD6N0R5_9EURO|nr:hypothetical protein N7493_001876 [Penicillium malachiteum]